MSELEKKLFLLFSFTILVYNMQQHLMLLKESLNSNGQQFHKTNKVTSHIKLLNTILKKQ